MKHWLQLLIFTNFSSTFFHDGRSFIIYHFPIPARRAAARCGPAERGGAEGIHLCVRKQYGGGEESWKRPVLPGEKGISLHLKKRATIMNN
jgi:hypothetical protein